MPRSEEFEDLQSHHKLIPHRTYPNSAEICAAWVHTKHISTVSFFIEPSSKTIHSRAISLSLYWEETINRSICWMLPFRTPFLFSSSLSIPLDKMFSQSLAFLFLTITCHKILLLVWLFCSKEYHSPLKSLEHFALCCRCGHSSTLRSSL